MDDIGNANVAVGILAKDCISSLERNLPEIEKFSYIFKNVDFYIIENDSKDGTKEKLLEWSKKNKNVYLNSFNNNDLPYENRILGNRIQRMAKYRNLYLKSIFDMGKPYDYLIIIDIDLHYFNVDGIVNSIKNAPADWISLFSNGRYYLKGHPNLVTNYYDTYALYFDEKKINGNSQNKLIYLYKEFYTHRYVSCESAFGGIGVYKYNTVFNKYYEYEEIDGVPVCEHWKFNRQLKQYGVNYIDRDMNVLYEDISLIRYLFFLIFPLKLKRILHIR